MAYTKLESGITESTIWQAPDTTRIVWITMLSMADQNGYIGASVPGLAGRARVTLDACVEALATFLAPDKWSRTKDYEGRRIAEADGGWVLLNHAKYRAAQNAEDRRERSRIAMSELRDKRKRIITVSASDSALTKLPQAEAEADTKKETLRGKPRVGEGRFPEFWNSYPSTDRKVDRKKCLAKWRLANFDEQADEILAHLSEVKPSRKWTEGFEPAPLRYLNGEQWRDGVVVQAKDRFAGAI